MLNYTVAPSDYTFKVSVSTTCYKTKEEFEVASSRLIYRKQEVSVLSLCGLIKEGHLFCHCYDDNDEPFDNTTKTQDNFRYTSYVAYDIDYNTLRMEEYLTTLTYQPTIAYTTTSDGLPNKGYRYRLIYCFDSKVKGNEQYESVFETMQVECGIRELKDNCTRGTHQPIFGNALSSCRMVCTNYIYSIPTAAVSTASRTRGEVPKQIKKKKRKGVIVCNDTFMTDFEQLPLWKFVSAYCSKYPRIEESELTYNNGYATIDENYLRIYRKWDKETRHIHIWKDGEGRRKRLSTAAFIIRRIKPDITCEHLIYCLAYEVTHYYDNSDGVLNQDFILRVAESALSKSIDEITIKGRDRRKFKVDMEYWECLGVSPKAAVAKARGAWNDDRIGELFDLQLTDKENVEAMAEYGVKTSVSSLKRWRKKHGITKYNKESNQRTEQTNE